MLQLHFRYFTLSLLLQKVLDYLWLLIEEVLTHCYSLVGLVRIRLLLLPPSLSISAQLSLLSDPSQSLSSFPLKRLPGRVPLGCRQRLPNLKVSASPSPGREESLPCNLAAAVAQFSVSFRPLVSCCLVALSCFQYVRSRLYW